MRSKQKEINADRYYSPATLKALGQRGGARPGSGRPKKLDKSDWGQITCILRRDTIERLKAGADSKHFGEYLQYHLDRYPLPTREQYLAVRNQVPIHIQIKRRRLPVLVSRGSQPRVRTRAIPRRKLSQKEFVAAILAADNH